MENMKTTGTIKNGISSAQAWEALGKIKMNLGFLSVDRSYTCIMFSSSVAGEGKSTIVANLALSLSASEKKVLIIDADLRRPTQHKLFKVVNQVGLSDIMAKRLDWHEYTCETDTSNIKLITAGRTPPNPAEMLASKRMGEFLNECREAFDYVLVDCPPILLVADTISLSKHADGIVIVVRYNYTTRQALASVKEELKLANVRIIGTIFNAVGKGDIMYDSYGYNNKYYESINTRNRARRSRPNLHT